MFLYSHNRGCSHLIRVGELSFNNYGDIKLYGYIMKVWKMVIEKTMWEDVIILEN